MSATRREQASQHDATRREAVVPAHPAYTARPAGLFRGWHVVAGAFLVTVVGYGAI